MLLKLRISYVLFPKKNKLNRSILPNRAEPNIIPMIYQFFLLFQKRVSQSSMTLEWDTAKPTAMNEKSWRRKQIAKFQDTNPKCKPKDVLAWVLSHVPNPWPSFDSNSIGKIMRRILKATKEIDGLSICHSILSYKFQPLLLKWDWKKPQDTSVNEWRRIQLTRYLIEFPTHKPNDVLK